MNEDFFDAMCWSLVASNFGWGFIAGWYYYRYRSTRQCLYAVLFVLFKLHKRGVYMTAYDRAVINVALDHIHATK